MGKETVSYLHSYNMGDLLSILPGIRRIWMDTDKKGDVFQRIGQPGNYYDGATHPVTNDNGDMVCFNEGMLKLAEPLLKYQEYISNFKEWEGEKIVVNFDTMRQTFINMPFGEIKRWSFYVFPDMATDLSVKWLSVPDGVDERVAGKMIINKTERYSNPAINYFFLKEYQDRAVFTGTKKEHKIFTEKWKLDIPYLKVNDFLELAIAINSCKCFLGSQSMQFQIAEGLKVPRIVELCSFAPNVIPQGANGYDFYHNGAAEYYVQKLMA